jgi:MYXO-CTERM domain-containing protein
MAGPGARAAWSPVTKCRDTIVGAGNSGDCIDPAYYCRRGGATPPIDGGCQSITGGVIVDSCQWPDGFRGRYYFADSTTRNVYTLAPATNRNGIVAGSRQNFAVSTFGAVHMAVGPDGALYWAVINAAGYVSRIAPRLPRACPPHGGAGDAGASGAGSGARGGSGAVPAEDDSGCDCRVATRGGTSWLALGLLGLTLLARRRRRSERDRLSR